MQDLATLSINVDSTQVRRATDDLKGLEQSSSATEQSVFSLQKAMALLGTAIAAVGLYNAAKDATMLAARYETLGTVMSVMGNNAGLTSGQMATLQKELMATGISAIKARESLNMLAAAQVDMRKSAELARVAQDAAVIGNMNSSEAFNNLVKSIQTGMAITAHHMGIIVSYENSYKKLAAQLGKTTTELTEHEKTTARMNAVLEEGAKRAGVYEASMGTAGKQLKSMERYIEDLQVRIGGLFGPTLTAAVFGFSEGLNEAQKSFDKFASDGSATTLAYKIKAGFQDAVGAVVSFSKFLYEHKNAILAVGIAWASISIGKKVFDIVTGIQNWMNVQRAWAAQQIQVRLMKDADEFVNKRNALSLYALSQAEKDLIRAEYEAAVAIRAKGMAANNTTVALEMMNVAGNTAKATFSTFAGIFSVIVTVVSMAATSMLFFRESAMKSAEDAIKSAQDYKKEIDNQIAAQQKFWELKASGKTTKESIDETVDAVDNTSQIKALDTAFGELQSRLQKLRQEQEDSIGTTVNKALGLNSWRVATVEMTDLEKKMKDIIALREELVQGLNTARQGQRLIEEERMKAGKEGKKEEGIEKEPKENIYKRELLKIEKEIAGIRENETLQARAQAEIDKLRVEQRQREEAWQKERDKKNPSLTHAQYDDLVTQSTAEIAKKELQIRKELAAALIELENDTNAKILQSENLTWKQKEDNWARAFQKLDEEYKKRSGKSLNDQDRATYMTGQAEKELPREMNRLRAELEKIAELKGRALTFDEEMSNLDVLEKKLGSTAEATKRLKEMMRQQQIQRSDYFAGLRTGFEEFSNSMGDLFSNGKRLASDFANYAVDALTKFAMTGKFQMKDMLSFILVEITRFMMAKAVSQFIQFFISSFGGGGGGGATTTAPAPAPGRAIGGPVWAGETYMVGENGPELFTANQSGRITNNVGSAGQQVNNIEIIMNIDAKTGETSEQTKGMVEMFKQLPARVREIVIAELQEQMRVGNKLNPLSASR